MTPPTSSAEHARPEGTRDEASEGVRSEVTGAAREATPEAGRAVCEGSLIAGHPVPQRLAETGDPGVATWRDAHLPALVEEVLAEWRLAPGPPFTPGGSNAWVAPVRDSAGADLVLKVARAHDESRDEAAGMAAWQGFGAARVLRAEVRGQTSLLLMEHVRPGTPLSQSLPWPERDEVTADLLVRLWSTPVPVDAPFRPLEQMCRWWAEEATQRHARRATGRSSPQSGETPAGSSNPRDLAVLPHDLVEHGLGLFRELPRRWDGETSLLATDLHPGNVLAAAGSWVLIDPKPYVGDPHYDVLQHMLNDRRRLVSDPSGFAGRMAELAGLDPGRVRQWLLARCVQEAGVFDGAAQAALRLAADGTG